MSCMLFAFMGICLLKEHINRDDESYLLGQRKNLRDLLFRHKF